MPAILVLALTLVAPVVAPAMVSAHFPGAVAAASPEPATNSADRIIFWDGYCSGLTELSDADLRRWRRNGAGGFACAIRQLPAWGGELRFTGNPDLPALNDPTDRNYPAYDLQRKLRDSRLAERARAHDLKLYMVVWTASEVPGARTPFVDWFDDAAWAGRVVPQLRQMAAAISDLGFAGIAFDHENYPAPDRPNGVLWSDSYQGNTHTPAETRAKMRERGREVGRAIVDVFPGVEYAAYYVFPAAGWNAHHQYERVGINEAPACNAGAPTTDFWEGMAAARGYDAIRFWESVFYKPANSGTNFDAANQYNTGELYSFLSRCWNDWEYASSRFHVSPFVWIDGLPRAGQSDPFNSPYPLDDVDEALRAFSKWGTGGEFANFAYALTRFDYSDYLPALRDAATPQVVDREEPGLIVERPGRGPRNRTSASKLELHGSAVDDLMIRSVDWTNDRGGSGSAAMTWNVVSGDEDSGFTWQMDWVASEVPIAAGQNCITVTATDIKGLTRSRTVAVNREDGCRREDAGTEPAP
jgi:hypothetical protein